MDEKRRRLTAILAARRERKLPMHAVCPQCGERATIVSRVDLRNGTNRVLDRKGVYECKGDCGRLWGDGEVYPEDD